MLKDAGHSKSGPWDEKRLVTSLALITARLSLKSDHAYPPPFEEDIDELSEDSVRPRKPLIPPVLGEGYSMS